jgi:DNA polymerase-3 subunit delta'
MLFSSIPGLQETKEKLVHAIQKDHLAHALLFHGREGSANLAMALALATYINCEQKGENDACGSCSSCQKMEKLVHPDVNFSFPIPSSLAKDDDAENKKQVDTLALWRSFALGKTYGNLYDWSVHSGFEKQMAISKGAAKQIIKTLSLKSFEGGYKMMLIWAPETMHVAAANAILKILEEPPAKTLFLMVSQQPENLLTTIQSRTQKIMVRGFTDEEIQSHLVAQGMCSKEAAEQISPLADGNMREAYILSGGAENRNTVLFRDWLRLCFSVDINNILSQSEALADMNKEVQKTLILTGINTMRECLLNKAQTEHLMRSSMEDREFIGNLSTHVLNEKKIMQIYQKLNEAHYHLERNANTKILFLDLSFNLAKILKSQPQS